MKKRFSKVFNLGNRVTYEKDSFPGLIDEATDIMMTPDVHMARIIAACDKAGELKDSTEIVAGVRAARKKVQDDYHLVVMYGLVVIDALVKNNEDNFFFLKHVAEEKMMKSLVRLVDRGISKGGHDHLEAMEKVLDMVQAWGEGFHDQQDKGLRLFVSTYHELKSRNVRFPPKEKHSVGIFTPGGKLKLPPQSKSARPGGIPVVTTSDGFADASSYNFADHDQMHLGDLTLGVSAPKTSITLAESLAVVANTVSLLEDSLHAVESAAELSTDELIKEMVAKLESSQRDLHSRLEGKNIPDNDLHKILHMNDSIIHVIKLHDQIASEGFKKKAAITTMVSMTTGTNDSSIEIKRQAADMCVQDFENIAVGSNTSSTPRATVHKKPQEGLEVLDFFASNNPEDSAFAEDILIDTKPGTHVPSETLTVNHASSIDLEALYRNSQNMVDKTMAPIADRFYGLGSSSSVSNGFSNSRFEGNANPFDEMARQQQQQQQQGCGQLYGFDPAAQFEEHLLSKPSAMPDPPSRTNPFANVFDDPFSAASLGETSESGRSATDKGEIGDKDQQKETTVGDPFKNLIQF